MQTLWAEWGLTSEGWQSGVTVKVDQKGSVLAIEPNTEACGTRVGLLLPSPANIHSHAFQRAMAGMTESRGDDPSDNFWTWRKLMYKFLDQLTPEDIEAIAAFVQMEMLEAGFGASVEFHYLHHQTSGASYDDPAELSKRICAAAETSGIGLTLLPVLYEQGGCDGRALGAGQIRFGNDLERFAKVMEGAGQGLSHLTSDCKLGVAPHSLRAVKPESLRRIIQMEPSGPVHMHLAEQVGEVKEVVEYYGQRPTEYLLNQYGVDERWCLIHATQMEPHETIGLAKSGAVAGLCPFTEANLGDGIFDGVRYLENGGLIGIGSDSNIRISLSEELRALEYSQRLKHLGRAVLASKTASTGRTLWDAVNRGGARASGRKSGVLKVGNLADMMALDSTHVDLIGKTGDMILDSYIFAGDDRMVTDVWSAGRHLVQNGAHIRRGEIYRKYSNTVRALKQRL